MDYFLSNVWATPEWAVGRRESLENVGRARAGFLSVLVDYVLPMLSESKGAELHRFAGAHHSHARGVAVRGISRGT